jgi:hypothetical protein
VNLVQKQDRPLPVSAEPFGRPPEHTAYVGDRRGHGRELLEGRARGRSDDPREGRLAAPGRAEEDRRADPILRDRPPQG